MSTEGLLVICLGESMILLCFMDRRRLKNIWYFVSQSMEISSRWSAGRTVELLLSGEYLGLRLDEDPSQVSMAEEVDLRRPTDRPRYYAASLSSDVL